MLDCEFTLTQTDYNVLRRRSMSDVSVRDSKDTSDVVLPPFSRDAGEELARDGVTYLQQGKNRKTPVYLYDVRVLGVNLIDPDPRKTYAENQAVVREYIESRANGSKGTGTKFEMRQNKKLLEAYDKAVASRGVDGNAEYRFPDKVDQFVNARDVVKGDTVKWTEAVFKNGVCGREYIGERTIEADVVEKSINRTAARIRAFDHSDMRFKLVVKESSGTMAVGSGAAIARSGEILCKRSGVQRRLWMNETMRTKEREISNALIVSNQNDRDYKQVRTLASAYTPATENIERPPFAEDMWSEFGVR